MIYCIWYCINGFARAFYEFSLSYMICYDALARRLKDANKVLSRAKATFAGTRQEVQVLIAASQLYVEKGG